MEDKEKYNQMIKLINRKCKMKRACLYGLQDVVPSSHKAYEALA